jgi:uncharacterized cupin superfamily protein
MDQATMTGGADPHAASPEPTLVRFDAPPQTWPLLPPTALASAATGTPVEHGLELFSAPGLSVGLWSCTAWTSVLAPYPVDEVMVLLEGTVRIRFEDGTTRTIRAGESFYLPKGLPCAWEQDGSVRKIYVIYEEGLPVPGAGQGGTLRIDPATPLSPCEGLPARVLLTPVPTQREARTYADASGRFTTGLWSSTPYARVPLPHPAHELMHIFAGHVTLTPEGGAPQVFGPGESVFVPQGLPVAWQSTADVTKLYCKVTL